MTDPVMQCVRMFVALVVFYGGGMIADRYFGIGAHQYVGFVIGASLVICELAILTVMGMVAWMIYRKKMERR